MEKILRMQDVRDLFTKVRPRHIVIGADDFAEMMHLPEMDMPHTFRAEYIATGKLVGMDVTIVPWIRGFVVLP
jgi:hypothetical protein